MDRNRKARKSIIEASANGLSRRRQRDEDGPIEWQETAGLRVKKDRDGSSRGKRRRGDRLNGGEKSSEESVNDDEDDYDDERGCGGGGAVRMLPPSNPTVWASTSFVSL